MTSSDLDLALQGAHGVDGLVDLVEQALAFLVGVLQLANDARDVDALAGNGPASFAMLFRLGLDVDCAAASQAEQRSSSDA